jgi:hypothetical protein
MENSCLTLLRLELFFFAGSAALASTMSECEPALAVLAETVLSLFSGFYSCSVVKS